MRKYKDIKLSWILDRVVIPITIGGMFVRFGNFFNSEINGKIVSDQYPLGVKFVQNGMLSPHRAMALTEQTDAQEAYRLITHDPRFAEVLASIPSNTQPNYTRHLATSVYFGYCGMSIGKLIRKNNLISSSDFS